MPASRSIRSAWIALLALSLLIPGFTPVSGEKPEEGDSGKEDRLEFVDHAEVEISLLEVVVLDRRGHHVRNLPASAFRLLEGREEIDIATFDEIDLAGPATASAQPVPSSPREQEQAPEPQPSPSPLETEVPGASTDTGVVGSAKSTIARSRIGKPRWIVLLFDGYNNPSILRISRSRNAAKNWVLKNLRENDRAAVFELNPYLVSLSGFSNDPFTVRQAIDDVHVFPGTSMGREIVEQKLQMSNTFDRDQIEQQLLNVGRFGSDLLSAERDQFYVGLHDLSQMLAGLEGTKAILLFSGGFPITRTRSTAASSGFTVRFRRMLREIQRQGVRVYTFDVGEEGVFTEAEEASNMRLQLDALGLGTEWLDTLQIGAQIDSAHSHHEILSVLGSESGGRFMRGRDYQGGMQAVDDDLNHYYLIGYRPSDTQRKSRKYLPLNVRMTKPKLKVIARRGSFLDKKAANIPEPVKVTAVPAEPVAPPVKEELRISCRPLFYPGPEGKTLAVLPIRVGGPVKTVQLPSGQRILDLTLEVEATASGETVTAGDRQIRATLESSAGGRIEGGVLLLDAVVLPSAALELNVRVKLNGLDLEGEWEEILKIPARTADRFGLGEMALLSPMEKALLVFDVFRNQQPVHGTGDGAFLQDPLGEEAGHRPLHLVSGSHPRNVPLLAQVGIVDPPQPQPGGGSPLKMDWEMLPSDGGDPLAPPIRYRRIALADDGTRLDVVADLMLGGMPAGEYTLRLTAENLLTHEKDVRTAPLSISN